MKKQFQSKSVPRGTRTIWRYLGALFLLFTFAVGNVWAVDYSPLNYNGGSELPSGYKYYGSSTGVENKSAFSIGTYQGHTVFDVTAGGTGAYNKRAIEFTVSEDCTLDIEFYVGGDGRILNLFHGNSTVVHSSTGTTKGDNKYTFSYSFENIKSDQTYSLSGSGSKVYISKITFTPAVACTETAPTSVAVSGGATYDKGDALSNLSAAVTGGTGTMSYQWYRNTTNAATVSNELKLANCTTATLAPSNKVGTYYYYCVASNCAGSVTSGTTAVTINPVCPPSGTIYKFQVKTGLTNGNLVTSVPKDVDMTTDNYLSALVGGELMAAARNNVNRINITGGNAIGFSNGADAYLEMTLDCAIQAGDIIKYTVASNNMLLRLTSASTEANQLTLDRTKTQVEVPAAFVGATKLYMIRASSSPNISYFEVVRPVYRTITLEYADGATPDGSIKVLDGEAATKPADPTKEHCAFAGWYNGANPYDWSAAVTGDLTLTAHWTQLYTVTFANGGGSGDAPAAVADKAQGETFAVPANTFTAPEGKEFDKWNDGSADYAPGATYTVGTDNVVLTAVWKQLVAKYTVVFKDGETELGTKMFEVGSNPSDAEIDKTKALYTFAAWQKDEADIALDAEFWATVVKDATVTLTARWAVAYASNVNFKEAATQALGVETALNTYHYASDAGDISFEEKGLKIKTNAARFYFNVAPGKVAEIKFGNISGATYSVDGGAAETLTSSQLKATYSASAQSCVMTMTTAAYNIVEKVTIHDPYQVTFDANEGDPVASQYGYPSVTLPLPVKGTESFLGWFDGETKVGEAGDTYIPTANITLVAHWEAISTDNTLSDLKVGGVTVDGFDPAVHTYYVVLPYGTAVGDIPVISATANSAKAKQVAIQQAVWTDEPYNCYRAQANVQAEDESWGYYDVRFSFAPKDGVSIIKVATTGGTNKTVTGLYAGDGDVNLSSNMKMDNGKYIGFTLAGTTLQAGDRINVHTTEAANTGGSHIIFYDNMTDKNELYETGEIGGTGNNIFTINAAMVGHATAYVYRANNDAAHQWNGKVNFIEVTRAMNPVLTAITFDGVDGEQGVGNTFSATLPNGTNLASMTVVPTIIKNGEGGSAAPTAAWAWGANTYRVTDKDGDYTDYTITLTEAAAPSAAPVITAQPVGANYLEGAAIAALEVVATGSGTLSYQWYKGADAIDGATASTYTPAVSAIGSYVYHCVVTNTEVGHPATSLASDNATITIAEDPAAIKLLDGEGNVNTTDFITGVSKNTVNYGSVDHNCATFGSTASTAVGASGLNKFIIYNAKTDQTKIKFVLYNTQNSAQKLVLQKLAEGGDAVEEIEIDVPSKEEYTTDYYAYNSSLNRTMYAFVKNTGIKVLQVKVIDNGTALKQFGEVGYSINFNQGRLFLNSGTDGAYDGLTYNAASNYAPLTNSGLSITKSKAYSFSVPADVTMTVTAANNAKYYITQTEDGEDNETAVAAATSFDLTAGTWYLRVAGSNLGVTNIAFAAPKCAEPVIETQPATNHTFNPGDMTATVVATVSEGTLHYQWYKKATVGDDEEVGTDAATLTTTTEGTYYVVVTNVLAGHQNTSVTSDEAELGYRVTNDATLMALSYGTPATAIALEDGVYTYNVELAKGTTDVPALAATATMDGYATVTIVDAAEFVSYAASSTVTVKSEDLTVTKVYTVNFAVKHDLPQVDVTASTTWNWANAATTLQKIVPETKDVEQLMANIDDEGKQLKNDAEFNSQALIFSGQEALEKSGSGANTRWFAKGGHIKFNVTVPGTVEVEFSDNGNNNRRVKINNAVSTVASANNTDVKTYKAYVQPGEVTLMGVKNDGTGVDQYIRISKIIFTANPTPDYTRNVSNNIGTLCVDHNVLAGGFVGATFYQIAGRNQEYSYKIDFEEVGADEELVAGEPYIFQSTTGKIELYYGKTVATQPVDVKGMHGTFSAFNLSITEENKLDIMYISNNKLWNCGDLVGTGLNVVENRAYIVMSEVPEQTSSSAPGRRRITLVTNAEQVATGVDTLNASETPVKVMINGQIFILRGEKMFDATGRLVK